MDNGAKVVDGWEDAYYGRLHPGRRQGRPADRAVLRLLAGVHRRRRHQSTTSALLDTCFRQVEYAGVLEGADNPEGAEALVDFLLRRGAGGAAGQHVRLPGRRAGRCPPDWASTPSSPTSRYRGPGRDRRATATTG